MTITPKLPLKHTSEQSAATIPLGIREAMRLSCFAMAGALRACGSGLEVPGRGWPPPWGYCADQVIVDSSSVALDRKGTQDQGYSGSHADRR